MNELDELAKKERNIIILNIYNECNEKINCSKNSIAREMAQGENKWFLFYKENPKLDYDTLFKKYYKDPYNKPILDRLREMYPEPKFKCEANYHAYSDGIDYSVYVSWGEKNQCQCILL